MTLGIEEPVGIVIPSGTGLGLGVRSGNSLKLANAAAGVGGNDSDGGNGGGAAGAGWRAAMTNSIERLSRGIWERSKNSRVLL